MISERKIEREIEWREKSLATIEAWIKEHCEKKGPANLQLMQKMGEAQERKSQIATLQNLLPDRVPLMKRPEDSNRTYAGQLLISMFEGVYLAVGQEPPSLLYERGHEVVDALMDAIQDREDERASQELYR